MKFLRILVFTFIFFAWVCGSAFAQDTASLTGTVTDTSGAVLAGAEVTVSSSLLGVNRTTSTNNDGDWLVSGLPIGAYDLTVAAHGFKKFRANGVVLRVGQKARVDASLAVGEVSAEVVVSGQSVAQVDTQSSEIAGTVTSKELTQLQLNGRDFAQLITTVPGVSSQTGQDEGTVGVNGNVLYSVNGGREENNNFELDGGDNMDNGSNNTLNVYPSIDAIGEVRVLTSNYGAQYGRNASGTVETEIKNGTSSFHGDVYEFNRNDFFNARGYFDQTHTAPEYKKNDFGYTVGGPFYIPGHYNTDKSKTFFFFSEEWRREIVPPASFRIPVPSMAERQGDFTDVCPGNDCPTNLPAGVTFDSIPADANAQAILAEIPAPNNPAGTNPCSSTIGSCYDTSAATPTHWREELLRVDHNINNKNRISFHYIHDSWDTVVVPTLWSSATLPNLQTKFVGPGTSAVARLTTTASPTLMNEFVMSYTGDHIFLTNTGPWQRPASMTMTAFFNNGYGGKLPAVTIGGNEAYGFTADPSYEPWNNANPTYTLRDNVSKIIGKHNLQFGAYAVIAQKNQQNSPQIEGALNFDASNGVVSTGNAFADLLLGNIDNYSQTNLQPKYYDRYQFVEPYFQDDFHITSRLTLNLGLRISLFGTYYEKFNREYNWTPSAWVAANEPSIDPDTGALMFNGADVTIAPENNPIIFNGMIQCGGKGVPHGCLKGHLFNPAPRVGFAWDPWGNGKTSIRGGYGIFFDHGNGNEATAESLEGSPPLVLTPSQSDINGDTCGAASGYLCLGGGALAFPLGLTSIPDKAVWPYMQQWNLSVQHELPQNVVVSAAYVGSKGTHLGDQRDFNQLFPLTSGNPYNAGEPIVTQDQESPADPTLNSTGQTVNTDCSAMTVNGSAVTGQALTNLSVACGNDPSPYRPYVGFASITRKEYEANSIYNSFQLSARRTIAPLTVALAYTYSHSIDDASDWGDTNFVNSYNLRGNRGSSNFDQRHLLSATWVYTLPNVGDSQLAKTALHGWEYSGIFGFATGTPFSVTNGIFGDNAGVANGVGTGSYADVVGHPNGAPSSDAVAALSVGSGPLLFNPAAYAQPTGLTFGNSGRNSLNNPHRLNFDMAMFKTFQFTESVSLQFRTEVFNIFNHTQWSGVNADISCYGGANNSAGDAACLGNGFLQPSGAHLPRILQFGLKLLF